MLGVITYSTPSAKALTQVVLDNYNVGLVMDCRFLSRGLNDTFLILTKESQYILRIYRAGWRDHSDILFELEALLHLAREGISVSIPIKRGDGELVGVIAAPEGPRHMVLFSYAAGKEPQYDMEAFASAYGRAVARVHAKSDTFHSVYERFELNLNHLLDLPIQSILPFLSHRNEDDEYVTRLGEKLRRRLEDLPLESLEMGFCHGDFNTGNVHQEGENGMTFFDFDCCGVGWRAYDIAVFRWNSRLLEKDKEWWPSFLHGYRDERSLADIDIKATDVFVAIRHLWLLDLHIGIGRDAGYGFLNDRYFDRGLTFLRKWEAEFLEEESGFEDADRSSQ